MLVSCHIYVFDFYRLCFYRYLPKPHIIAVQDVFATIIIFPCHQLGGAVHTYTDESSAHTKRVIVNYSHGHLFSSDDIIMEIPMQDRTISMSPYKVKVEAQV